MRILVVHNRYRTLAPSGENIYVEKELAELIRIGHDVLLCNIDNDIYPASIFGSILAIIETIIPIYSFFKIFYYYIRLKPDLIHFHNTFPRVGWLSLSVFARRSVITLHNYRIFCANGMAIRNNSICVDCSTQQSFLPSIIHRCYRGSLLATIGIQVYIYTLSNFGRLNSMKAIYCFSNYQKFLLVQSGKISGANVRIKNNYITLRNKIKFRPINTNIRAVFVGRFSEEKGLGDLYHCIRANSHLFERVDIIGGNEYDLKMVVGRDYEYLELLTLHGLVKHEYVAKVLSESDVLFVPSICLEGQPTVVFEALEAGCLPILSKVPTLEDLSDKLGLKTCIDFKNVNTFGIHLIELILKHNQSIDNVSEIVNERTKSFQISHDLYNFN